MWDIKGQNRISKVRYLLRNLNYEVYKLYVYLKLCVFRNFTILLFPNITLLKKGKTPFERVLKKHA